MAIASVKASGSDGNGAANTMDGKLNTRWSAFGKGQWIQYDLGATKTVGRIDIACHLGNRRTATWTS